MAKGEERHSYLELSVLPGLRQFVISPLPAIVFSAGLDEVLWSNAAGARLFGGKGVIDLLSIRLPERNPVMRQLRATLEAMGSGRSLVRGFRFAAGGQTRLLQFEVTRIDLPGGEHAIRVIHLDHDTGANLSEADLARDTVQSLEGFADACAVIGEERRVIAASPGFDTGYLEDTLFDQIGETGQSVVRCIINPDEEQKLALGFARISARPERGLLVVAGGDYVQRIADDQDDPMTAQVVGREVEHEVGQQVESATTADQPREVASDIAAANTNQAAKHADIAPRPVPSLWDEQDTDSGDKAQAERATRTGSSLQTHAEDIVAFEQATTAFTPQFLASGAGMAGFDHTGLEADPKAAEELEPEQTAQDAGELQSEADETREHGDQEHAQQEKDDHEPVEPGQDEIPTPAPTPVQDIRPTNFAWTMDENRKFVSVSDALAQRVGARQADIVGKTWSQVDEQLSLDEDGRVSSLLLQQNTWSSVTVMWPVDGPEPEKLAIELAALPVFGKDRKFAGFRGFGKFPEEVVPEPSAVDLLEDEDLSAGPVREEQSGETPSASGPADGAVDGQDGDETHRVAMQSRETEDELPEDTRSTDGVPSESAWEHEDVGEREEENPDTQAQDNTEPPLRLVNPDNDSGDDMAATPVSSNVVQFSRNSNLPLPREMTQDEQRAFSTLRDRLSEFKSEGTRPLARIEKDTSRQGDRPVVPADTGLLEKLPVAVFVYRDDEILYANQHFLRVTGFGSVADLKESRSASQVIGTISDKSDHGHSMLLKRDDSKISISPVLHTVPWDGEKAVLLSFALPVEKNSAAAKVELSRLQEIQNILDTTNDGIILMEGDGVIISVNGPAEALFGLRFEDVADTPFENLFAPESRDVISEYLERVKESGVNRLINDGAEALAQEKGGGFIPVFLTVTRLETSGKLCAVLRDITSWKKTEQELIQSRRKAEHSSDQKSEFLAQVSHEIRTPLNAIIGFSDVMIEERFGPIGSNRYREYLRDIKRSGAHVLEIVNGLLDLARIEAGKLDLSFEAVDLNELVAETVALLQPDANINRTIIRTSLSRSVPKVVADPRSIRQIVLNLVSNAIKYSLNNSQVVISTVYESNGEVALRVRDTGAGMTREQIARAMKPFEQAHDFAERSIQGSGLGLPLTKALVEANRAFFEVESEPGLGTIAHVQFPVQRVLSE